MFEIDRVLAAVEKRFTATSTIQDVYNFVVTDGDAQIAASIDNNTKMAVTALAELTEKYGNRPLTLMTHCNTGFLACGTRGTALGVISYAHSRHRVAMVYADETRPYMQGARLTAYELGKEGIPYNIVVEGAASYVLSHQNVDAIFVGADRIAANGDTANKIGTATLAIVAKHYGIPFYVVAPLSSFDFNMVDGTGIEIELRHEDEILSYKNHRVAPPEGRALNPSFDVTPSSLITGIICERGIVKHPNSERMQILK
jgi:methylthioribose-1-phosphate isomerase